MEIKYYYRRRPKNARGVYEVLIFDLDNKPFPPLIIFYHDQSNRLAKSTINNYLEALLPFFTWLDKFSSYQGKKVHWNSETDAVRHAIDTYFRNELNCQVSLPNGSNYAIVKKTSTTLYSFNQFNAAIKKFYKTMSDKEMYLYQNPVIDERFHSSREAPNKQGERKGKPRMPAVAGTEKPTKKTRRKLTDSYFKIVNNEWVPVVITDRDLPFVVYKAGNKAGWRLREKVIARMLFETGARASEIITMTMDGYRERRSILEAQVIDKGSNKVRRKFINFNNDTLTLLKRYINTERKKIDPLGLNFDQLPGTAPIFLTERNSALTYKAWYPHWAKAMKKEGLSLNPHKARHWYVTDRMKTIKEMASCKENLQQEIESLITYMAWKSKEEMLNVYEHSFKEEDASNAAFEFNESMRKREQEYLKKRSINRKSHKKNKVDIMNSTSSVTLGIQEDPEIFDLFEELEEILDD